MLLVLLLPFLGGVFYTTKRITIARTASGEELQAMLLKHFPMIANQTITWHQLDGATHEFQELRLAAVTPLALRQAPGLKRSKLYLMPASVSYRNVDLEIFYIWVGYALTIDSLILIVHWQKTCPTSTYFHTRDILHLALMSELCSVSCEYSTTKKKQVTMMCFWVRSENLRKAVLGPKSCWKNMFLSWKIGVLKQYWSFTIRNRVLWPNHSW